MNIFGKIYGSILKKISLKQYNKLQLKRAIKQAKLKWIQTGKRHYVIYSNGNYLIVNNSILKTLKKGKGKKWNAIDLINASAYFTPVSTFHNI